MQHMAQQWIYMNGDFVTKSIMLNIPLSLEEQSDPDMLAQSPRIYFPNSAKSLRLTE
ncbi:hypothetical protein GCM10010916_41200 [Paenibacillus abyssi]|uniref:Uncharacterized protein n=1 Tax=Paenibacillus abyssi TaxID=1340531 RepID=A0A917G2T5_9BACL|nr:hypothetical protein GCM10010916_41200 [Paenibacillus abyssi]